MIDLVRNDSRFWIRYENKWISGPTIGLYQKDGSKEPEGGWVWVTGEPVTYQNWNQYSPYNGNGTAWIGAFGYPPRESPLWNSNRTRDHWYNYSRVERSFIIEIE
ncbi:MAG: hypothetical protein K5905_12930 [Roseibium sp.]|uniref:hypothetical protein n=1 Tax=Roseibium sp. TaxID=1936156 RepID=UPI00260D3891|nr:hypothetical protein [Roseibium sp.]MCV0426371.1 hypothetical protein [Roseibium sp.]